MSSSFRAVSEKKKGYHLFLVFAFAGFFSVINYFSSTNVQDPNIRIQFFNYFIIMVLHAQNIIFP